MVKACDRNDAILGLLINLDFLMDRLEFKSNERVVDVKNNQGINPSSHITTTSSGQNMIKACDTVHYILSKLKEREKEKVGWSSVITSLLNNKLAFSYY